MNTKAAIRMSMDIDNMKFDFPKSTMTKVYCKCGRIVGLDSNQTSLKFALKKNVECIECRNARVAKDIEDLDAHFAGTPAESF